MDVGDRAAVISHGQRFDRYKVVPGLSVEEGSVAGWWLPQCGNIEIV